MLTVKELREWLEKMPDEAKVTGYMGQPITVMTPVGTKDGLRVELR